MIHYPEILGDKKVASVISQFSSLPDPQVIRSVVPRAHLAIERSLIILHKPRSVWGPTVIPSLRLTGALVLWWSGGSRTMQSWTKSVFHVHRGRAEYNGRQSISKAVTNGRTGHRSRANSGG